MSFTGGSWGVSGSNVLYSPLFTVQLSGGRLALSIEYQNQVHHCFFTVERKFTLSRCERFRKSHGEFMLCMLTVTLFNMTHGMFGGGAYPPSLVW